jgi:glycine hydroxymethyltransferase
MTDIFSLIQKETERQRETLMMIPSENYAYPEVRNAVGSVLMHKYSEGYPGRRYYQGNDYIDQIETAAVESAKKLFGTPHANVQPLSGSPANSAVLLALANPGDTVMGLSLASGGHLTHGHPDITFSGKFFRSVQFSMEADGSFDFEKLRKQFEVEKPKVIFIGTTAYPRVIDFELFAHACEGFPVTLVADISHIAGLVVTGLHPNPAPHVDVITTTTHKMLRGPRGGIILVTDKGLARDHELGKKIDRAVFPGMQGGPHDNVTAGIAIALEKAHESGYQEYTKRVLSNASVLSAELLSYGYSLVTGGTDNHLLLLDLRKVKISGKEASIALEKAGIVVNANSIPFDTASPLSPNGIRLGTPALSVRNMGESEMKEIAGLIHSVLSNISDEKIILEIKEKVVSLCKKFPVDF